MTIEEMLAALEAKLADVGKKWDALSLEMKPILDAHKKEIATLASNTNTDRTRLEELDAKLQEYGPTLTATQANYVELKKTIAELEKKSQRPGQFAEGGKRANYGRDFASSDVLKNYTNGLAWKSTARDSAFHKTVGGLFERKASVIVDEVTSGGLVTDWRRPDTIEFRKRIPVHRNWLTVLEIGETDRVIYSIENTEFMLVAKATAQANLGQKVVTVDQTAGILDATNIGLNAFTTTAGVNSGLVDTVDSATQFTAVANLTANILINELVKFPYFNFVAEAAISARSLDTFTEDTANVCKLSSFIKVSVELLEDAVRVEDLLNRRLLARIARMEEKAVFYGQGGTGQIEGFFKNSSIPTVTWSTQPPGTTKLDLLLYAITVPALSEYNVEVIFMHPNDWRDIVLTKGQNGQYVFYQIMVTGEPARVWGVPIVRTTACDSGDALAGEFSVGATLYDRMLAETQIGLDSDDLTKDLRTIIGRERIAFSVDIPAAFVIISFDAKP